MIDKKYSVLMSIYYKEKPEFFRVSLESMLNQTLKPDQIVIVKDGKLTEELDELVYHYVNNEPKLFTIVELEKNIGLGLALNEGLKMCRNELVARMDTDDISLSERCEIQVNEFIKNKDLSILGTMINEFYDYPTNIVSLRIVPCKHDEILKFSKRRSPFNHPTVMYKKTHVLACGGYRDIHRKEDIDLFVRMLNSGYISANIEKSLLLYRSNKDNLKRRKSWSNCKSYILVVYDFWKNDYSSMIDLLFVVASQLLMFILPEFILKLISDSVLRKKVK